MKLDDIFIRDRSKELNNGTLHIELDDAYYPLTSPSGTYYPVNSYGSKVVPDSMIVTEDVIEKLWDRMYERPVIIRCYYCDSGNVITNPTCVRCGAPLGKAVEEKTKK